MACVEDMKICESISTGEITTLIRDPKNHCLYPACPNGSREVEEGVEDLAQTVTPKSKPPTTPTAASTQVAMSGSPITQAPTTSIIPTTLKVATNIPQPTPPANDEHKTTTLTPDPLLAAHPSPAPSHTASNNDLAALDTTKWENIDANHTGGLTKATYRAFAGYNHSHICDELHVAAISYEKMLGTVPSAPQIYSVVSHVTCSLKSEERVAGKYILHFEEPKAGIFDLTMCGHVQDGGVTNWIAVDQGETVCQTPNAKDDFQVQEIEHVDHSAPTTFGEFFDKLKAGDGRAMSVAGAGIVSLLLLVLVVVVYRSRRVHYQATETASCSGTPNNKVGDVDNDEDEKESDDSNSDEFNDDTENKDLEEDIESNTTTGLRDSMKLNSPAATEEHGTFMNSPSLRHQV